MLTIVKLVEFGKKNSSRLFWTLSEKLGFVRRSDVLDELRRMSDSADEAELEHLVGLAAQMPELPLGYVFYAPHSSPTVVETMQRMLDHVESLTVGQLRDGLARRCRFRGLPTPPPVPTLTAFVANHSSFVVDGKRVSAANRRPVEDDTVVAWILRQIEATGLGVIHRTVLHDAARQVNLNRTTVQLFSSYSELLEPVAPGCIALVGTAPSMAAISEARQIAMSMVVTTRVAKVRETPVGPQLHVMVGTSLSDTGVLALSVAVATRLRNREFDALAGGTQRGHFKVSGKNMLIGLTGALMELDVIPGEQILITFDLARGEALVELPDE